MTLRETSALVSATLSVAGTSWYIWLVIRIKVRPTLASWIVFSGTMLLSFSTYWTSPTRSLVSNAANAAGVLSTVSILSVVWFCHWQRGGKLSFTSFQKWSLLTAGLIALLWVVLVWGLRGTGVLPNILTQVLMIIGYLVTVQKLWRAKSNTESYGLWGCLLLASVVGLYTGLVSKDNLAILYCSRATVATATIVWLMYRIEKR